MERPGRSVWLWAVLLGVLAAAAQQRALVAFDHWVAHGIAALRSPTLDAAATALTFFGSSLWLGVVLLAMGTWWWLRGARTTVALCLGALGLGLAMQVMLRLLVAQWRPDATVIPPSPDLLTRVQLAGFPSGHAFRAAFLCGWWAEALRHRRGPWAVAGLIACGVLTGVVGLTRVYLRRHWLSDVVGAWLVALTVLAVAATWRARRQAAAS